MGSAVWQRRRSSDPKPLVEIGGRPILWHIMEHYAEYGHDDFVIAARTRAR